MKASIIGVKYNDKLYKIYKDIKALLEKNGVNVDFSYLDTPLEQDYGDLENSFKRNQKFLKESDFIIAETTQYSSGIGFLIATGLNDKKPVLALYNKELGEKPSSVLKSSSTSSKMLSFVEYKEADLRKIIEGFIKEVKQKLDTKFILIIPSEIDRYLEWAATQRRMHKAQIVRKAIEVQMAADPEWEAAKS